MPSADPYARQVLAELRRLIIGNLDNETPVILVDSVADVTDASADVLSVEVTYRSGSAKFVRRIRFDEWEDFDDKRPHSMAAGLASLVRDEIRETVVADAGGPASCKS